MRSVQPALPGTLFDSEGLHDRYLDWNRLVQQLAVYLIKPTQRGHGMMRLCQRAGCVQDNRPRSGNPMRGG
jgi:hypothetical protein